MRNHGGNSGAPIEVAYAESFDQSRLKWAAYPIVFRSYEAVSRNGTQDLVEITNAQCQLKSKEFQASFVTPSSVKLPVVQGQPSVAVLTCKSGRKTGGLNIVPFTQRTLVVGDPVSMLVGNIAAGVAASRQQYLYSYIGEMIQVTLSD